MHLQQPQELPRERDGHEEEKERLLTLRRMGAVVFERGPNCRGIDIRGWTIQTNKHTILKMDAIERWEKQLRSCHLPEMVFGDSSLELTHKPSRIHIYFNAFDALRCWKNESLPPVEVSSAAKWKFRSKPSQEIILDYDYTFTTPYSGSEAVKGNDGVQATLTEEMNLKWVDCEERIDLVALQARDPILFYDEVILYEDELADNGVSLLTVKVRVMPSCWFLLLRFWLRVDGVLMRLRDTRMYCSFEQQASTFPTVLRERCLREGYIDNLINKGVTPDMLADKDGSLVCDRLPISKMFFEKLVLD